jgi:anti-sigma factor RsiW
MGSDLQNSACRLGDIAAYIDGELSPGSELAFEMHAANCPSCRNELNIQKNLLRELDLCLTTGELQLPKNFAKTVVANAECRVTGLRRPRERFTAVFICCTLLVFALFTLGTDAAPIISVLNSIGSKIAVVTGSVFHVLFDVALGVAIIFRSLGTNLVSGSPASLISLATVVLVSLLFLSRLLLRPHRL